MKFLLLAVFSLLLTTTPVCAQECTSMEAYAAESVVDYLSNWDEVFKAYGTFSNCIDGSIEEGFNEVITLLWADQWSELPKMLELTNKSPSFKGFIYEQVGAEITPLDRWNKIVSLASTECPNGGKEFCVSVLEAEEQLKSFRCTK